jgi:hypothetical protein
MRKLVFELFKDQNRRAAAEEATVGPKPDVSELLIICSLDE